MAGFTLRQLELIVGLGDHPTISAAAAALHISESGLSHAITELESLLGEQLCIRRRAKGVQLTAAGRYFVGRAKGILGDVDALAGELAELSGRLVGPVSLGCYPGLATTVLPPILERFPELFPDIHLSISMGSGEDMIPLVASGELDVAFLYDVDLPDGLEAQTIYQTEIMAILPQEHALSGRTSIDLAEISPDPLIMLDMTPSVDNTRRLFSLRGLTPNVLVSVPQLELVRALVGRGIGYSLLMGRPNWVPFSNEGRGVVAVPLKPHAGVTSVVAAHAPHPRVTRRTQALINFAADVFG